MVRDDFQGYLEKSWDMGSVGWIFKDMLAKVGIWVQVCHRICARLEALVGEPKLNRS